MFTTDQYRARDFHIIADVTEKFKPIDAICQFEYKDHQISISTAGLSKGACQSEVFVFGGENREKELKRVHTVQEAIEYIDGVIRKQQ